MYLFINLGNGVKVGTINRVTEDMVDLDNQVINYDDSTMKSHQSLSLPISKRFTKMLTVLLEMNHKVLEENNKISNNLFISSQGNPINSNTFGKRVHRYKQLTGLKTINFHAIRRGFAKKLLDSGVNVVVISKAFDHKSIHSTTQYLHIRNQEVIDALRKLE